MPQKQKGEPASKKYQEIANALRQKILSGVLKPGVELSHRDQLQEEFSVSRATLQRAVEILLQEGYLTSKRGVGTCVAPHPPYLSKFALVCPNPDLFNPYNLFWRAVITAANRVIVPQGCSLTAYKTGTRTPMDEGTRLQADLNAHRLGGVIFCTHPDGMTRSLVVNMKGLATVGWASRPAPEIFRSTFYFDHFAFLLRAIRFLKQRGRSNIAILESGRILFGQRLRELQEYITSEGVHCPTKWIQTASVNRQISNTTHLVQLLTDRSQNPAPDGLIVMDDNLVNDVCAGLASSGILGRDEITIVAHCNFPREQDILDPFAAIYEIHHLGFDISTLLQASMDNLCAQLRGEPVPEMTLLPPRFETEQ